MAAQAEPGQIDGRAAALGQVGQQLAQQRAEFEGVPAGAAPDNDVAHPVEHEVGVGGVVVDAALGGHGLGVERGEQARHGAGELRQLSGVVACQGGRVRRVEDWHGVSRRVPGHLEGAGVRATGRHRQPVDHVVAPLNEHRWQASVLTVPGGEVGDLGERGDAAGRGIDLQERQRAGTGADDDDGAAKEVPSAVSTMTEPDEWRTDVTSVRGRTSKPPF